MKNKKENYEAGSKEHLSYGLFFLGENFLWGFAGYIATYLTDIGFDPVTAAAILVAPKIWDAINDTIFGYIVDKTTFKDGQKFVPWIRIGTGGVAASLILMFVIPQNMATKSKTIWFIVSYLFFDLFYTLIDAPAFALPTAMTSNIEERTALLSKCKSWGMLGGGLATVIISMFRSKLGWALSSVIFGLVGGILMFPLVFIAIERSRIQTENKEKFSFSQMITYLSKNDALIIVLIAFFLFGMTSVESIMGLIVSRLCFKTESFATVITACSALPVVIVSLLIPKLSKKFDKFYIMLGGIFFSIIVSFITYIVGYNNMIVSAVFIGLKCSGMAFWSIIIYMLISDTTEYGYYKTGINAVGITFSLETFMAKLKGALVNSLVLLVLAKIGFVEGENVVQSAQVVTGVWATFNFMPVVGGILACALLIFFYKLRDKDVQIMSKYNRNEISYEEACQLLEEKYGKPAISHTQE